MIFQLLKQIPGALWRYIAYHTRRIFHIAQPRPADIAAAPPSVSVPVPATANAPLPDVELDPRYLEPVPWPTYRELTEPAELLSDPIYQIWTTIPKGHKWSQYFAIYRKLFDHRRKDPIRLLEIGIFHGSGLLLWRKYFDHPDTRIVGIDITPDCARFSDPNRGIEVRIGSQADRAFLDGVVREFGPFDIIIDDGSHHSAHMIESFNHLFGTGLKDSGTYVVEDLHANSWAAWRDSKKSFLQVCYDLTELMHAHYNRADIGRVFLPHAPEQHASIPVPAIVPMLDEVRVFDSVVAIQKTKRAYVPFYVTMETSEDAA